VSVIKFLSTFGDLAAGIVLTICGVLIIALNRAFAVVYNTLKLRWGPMRPLGAILSGVGIVVLGLSLIYSWIAKV